MAQYFWPPSAASAGSGPVQFVKDSVNTQVSQDTITPANSTPLPIIELDSSGNPVSKKNTAGAFAQATLVGTTAQTSVAPANAVGLNIQAPSTNTDNIRFCVGAVASASNGFLMEPGRSEILNLGANVSICATASGTNEFIIQWILTS